MIRLVLATFRSRWPLFLGALLSLTVGVGLINAAVDLAVSSATPDTSRLSPYEAAQVSDTYSGMLTVAMMIAILAGFLTIFIVATTFSFTVAQRRRELAQLRLVGASRRQIRLMLVGEAIVLGTAGALLGRLLTPALVAAQVWLFHRVGFAPPDFTVHHPAWAFAIAGPGGFAVALLGVHAASRSAARIPPMEALRDSARANRVMTTGRWLWGLLFLAGTVAEIVVAPYAGLVAALGLALGIAITGAVALAALSPVLVPLVGTLLGSVSKRSVIGSLAQASLRDGVRRTASAAAPLIALVALVWTLTGTLGSVTAATAIQQSQTIAGDVVVQTTGRDAAAVARLGGVAVASPEVTLPVTATVRRAGDRAEDPADAAETVVGIVAIDPAAYSQLHHRPPVAGRLASLDDPAGPPLAAVTEHPVNGVRYDTGATVTIATGRGPGEAVAMRAGAVLPELLSTTADLLVSLDRLPTPLAELVPDAPAAVVVRLTPGTTRADLAREARATHLTATVTTVRAWVEEQTRAGQQTNDKVLVVLLGLAGLYTAMSVVNAIVIAGASRRREHAVARLTGLTRGQVMAAVMVESVAVTLIGVLLGAVVTAGGLTGIAVTARAVVGQSALALPWATAAWTTLCALVIAPATAALTSYVAMRRAPIHLAAARE